MNTLIFFLLGLYVMFVLALGVVIGALILLWLSKKWKLSHATFKTSLIINLIVFVGGAVVFAALSLLKNELLSSLLLFVVSFFIYGIPIYVLYRAPFVRTLGLTVSAMVIIGIANFLFSAAIILPVRLYVIQPFYVKGVTMEPTYREGDYLLVQKIQRSFRRGDVVVFFYPYPPQDEKRRALIKRIIGLPGEMLETKEGVLYINNTKTETPSLSGALRDVERINLKDDEYFVVGDNVRQSFDSQIFGPIPASSIIGSPIAHTDIFQSFLKKYGGENK
ncbi:signal peptidase I [Candidatus Uhrbacteria bacterium]|nr:signal peptidase I [Candidatus Uhrbacteria bacterium]